ncbi:MAG: 23S rRNA (uracil(1939)-C(5))-methyltransferase RlmD [Clostridia bacterium]|nr:23S rRNA (uracil(1939)-C(5))-methyltransferase RlmD [Clostridia bacterium]
MKSRSLPVNKNDDVTLEITGINSDGQGVGRVNGYAVFVPGALIGETVSAHVIKAGSSFAVAKLADITVPSPDRVVPFCPAFPSCGGCTLQHLSYPAQLKLKTQLVYDAFRHIGRFENVRVEPILGMGRPLQYRNKGSFPFSALDDGTVAFGFFSPKSHRLIPLTDCPIQDPKIISCVSAVRNWAESNHIVPYDEDTRQGLLRHAVVRISSEGKVMVVVVTTGALPCQDALVSSLPDAASIWHNVNPDNTNVIFGKQFRLVWGDRTLCHEIAGCKYSISPQSFLQVNTAQTEVLYHTAIRFLNPRPDETIMDAYCGAGTISLLLSSYCKNVIGIESVPEAIADASRNAAQNSIQNTSFICGKVEDLLPKYRQSVSSVILDPPRKGCDPTVLSCIAESHIQRLVYVSCNPATLARDAAVLSSFGYSVDIIQPVDMFPHTSHVESVVKLTRAGL